MDFSFTEEQTLLRNSLSQISGRQLYLRGIGARFIRAASRAAIPHNWKQFAELGLLAAPLPEDYGGLGGGPVETHDRDGGVRPRLGGRAVRAHRGDRRRSSAKSGGALRGRRWLPKIAAGETVIAFAFAEPQGRYNLADLTTTAKKQGDSYVLNGQKSRGAGRALGGPADRHRAHRRAASATKRASASSWSTRIREGRRRRATIRRSTACAPSKSRSRMSTSGDGLIGTADDGLHAHRAGGGRRHRRASGRSVGRHEVLIERHGRIRQDPQAIRPADRQIPGAAAPHGGHVHRRAAGALASPTWRR